jgi:hypothetical protein
MKKGLIACVFTVIFILSSHLSFSDLIYSQAEKVKLPPAAVWCGKVELVSFKKKITSLNATIF